MKDFTSTPLSVKSVDITGYEPKTIATTNQPTITEIITNSPALIWGPVPQKKETVTDNTEIATETFIEKIIKAASQVAPNVTNRLLGYIK